MTVPDALCDPCQLRKHDQCEQVAISLVKNDYVQCQCPCRKQPRSMR